VPLVQAAIDQARNLLDKPAEHSVFQRRRELTQALLAGAQAWHKGIVTGLRQALLHGVSATRPGELPPSAPVGLTGHPGRETLSLVSDDTIELEIVTSRLALAIMDRASWEFADLRSRIAHLEGRSELCRKSICGPSSAARARTRTRRWAGRPAPGSPIHVPTPRISVTAAVAAAVTAAAAALTAAAVVAAMAARAAACRAATGAVAPAPMPRAAPADAVAASATKRG
jgi:hypothetical protein